MTKLVALKSDRFKRPLFFLVLVSALAPLHMRGQDDLQFQHKKGSFFGNLKFQWLNDGVHMQVLEPFSYTDGDGHVLSATTGFVTDGASIPQPLWSIIGSPFTGKYVDAAVIHDVGCVSHKYSWQITHRMFYDAMLDSGVNDHLAKIMYFGVRLRGPKWNIVSVKAKDKAALKKKVEAIGAVEVEETSGVSGTGTAEARVVVLLPQKVLTEDELRNFDHDLSELELRGQTLTLDQIESRADALQ